MTVGAAPEGQARLERKGGAPAPAFASVLWPTKDRLGPPTAFTSDPTSQDLLSQIHLLQTYGWLCRRRRDFPADADAWPLRPLLNPIPPALAQLGERGRMS